MNNTEWALRNSIYAITDAVYLWIGLAVGCVVGVMLTLAAFTYGWIK